MALGRLPPSRCHIGTAGDADLRDTGVILTRASQLLDLTQPVAVTLIAILNALPDADNPHGIVATLMDAVPSGSYRGHAGPEDANAVHVP